MVSILKLALKQVWRDTRGGDLLILMLTIMVAVASLSTVTLLADSVRRGLSQDASQLLGADLLAESDTNIPNDWLVTAQQQGLDTALTWQFSSMATTEDQSQLVSVKSVTDHYPLRGRLMVSSGPNTTERQAQGGPPSGQVWVDPQLLTALDVKIGDHLTLGDIKFEISGLISQEPDRGTQFLNLAPRAMFSAQDLERTGLVTLGSRLKYVLMVSGPRSQVEAFENWLKSRLRPGQRLVTVGSGRPELNQALDRAQQFLTLVGVLASLIATIGVVLGARQFRQRHLKSVRVMRCLGATQKALMQLFFLEFLIVGVIGSLVGVLLGVIGQTLVGLVLRGLVTVTLPAPSPMVAFMATILGVLLLLVLALPSLSGLNQIAPKRISTANAGSTLKMTLAQYLPAYLGVVVFLCVLAREVRLGMIMAIGFAMATGVFAFLSYVSLTALKEIRVWTALSISLRFGLSGLIRRRHATVLQISALAIGMMAILLLTMVRTDLLDGWQNTIPPDAPNRFMINIQTEQLDSVKQDFERALHRDLEWHPMIRGRLIEQNNHPISSRDFEDARAKQLIDREFNLSYALSLPSGSRLEEGRSLDPNAFEVSLESGLAKTLRLSLGDELVFDIAGQTVKVLVTSIRKVDWDSLRPNFFAIMSPIALKGQPQTWMTAFNIHASETAWLQTLVKRYPNVTVFDVGAILTQLREVIDKVSAAVQGLFGFSVAAGLLVLVVALSSTRDERIREAALLRSFGATQAQLSRAQGTEFCVIGAIAGVLAAAGASLITWVLEVWVFHFPVVLSITPWLLGLGLGVASSWIVGTITLRDVVRTSPMLVLRKLAV